jgi:hypothetical protein
MKKITLLRFVFASIVLSPLVTTAQQRTTVVSPSQMTSHSYVRPTLDAGTTGSNSTVSVPKSHVQHANAKTSAVSPVQMGTASNVFTVLRQEQNQVVTVPHLDMVAFIHRNNGGVFGGSSGELRYDLSTDGGATFTNDLGSLTPLNTNASRYPNMSVYAPSTVTNPNDAKLIIAAPTLNSAPAWDGHISGVVTAGQNSGTENYTFVGQGTYLQGGLCESSGGKFWHIESEGVSNLPGPNFKLYSGVFDPMGNGGAGDINFTLASTISPNWELSYDQTEYYVGPNIAFSPDGQTGWIGFLGDLVGGSDTTLLPCFMKSTDGGATWGNPVEVDLNVIPWIADSLQTLWTDSLGNPASNGRATTGFDYDITVDGNGNPHIGVVIGTTAEGYAISSGLAKFLADVTSEDGGATWTVKYISPVLCFRTPAFGTSTTVTMDNSVQVARDEAGCNIFFAWADSDTTTANGIGFGQSSNDAPNLRIAGLNIANGWQTYPKLVTDGDLDWEGLALFPTMAPVVLTDPAGSWKLPIVLSSMQGTDPINPASFYYFGNDARIASDKWCAADSMNLSYDFFSAPNFASPCTHFVPFCGAVVGTTDPGANGVVLDNAYPNPTNGLTVIGTSLPAATDVVLSLHNNLGQQVMMIANGSFAAGKY